MPDEITYDRVEEAEEKILEAISGVGDTVNGLPASLETDFTEVKNAIADTKENIEVKLDALDQAINNIQILASNTNAMVNDLLYDKNSAEWITDLETSGKSSVTYSTPDRMEYLFTLNSAVTNTKIDTILFDYGLSNNLNVGLFYQALLGNVSGVTWSELNTFDSVCKNTSAFRTICNNNRATTLARDNQTAFNTIANNYTVTENIIASRSVSLNLFSNKSTNSPSINGNENNKVVENEIIWLYMLLGKNNSGYDTRVNWSYTLMDDSENTAQTIGSGYTDKYGNATSVTVNRFVKKLIITSAEVNKKTSTSYPRTRYDGAWF